MLEPGNILEIQPDCAARWKARENRAPEPYTLVRLEQVTLAEQREAGHKYFAVFTDANGNEHVAAAFWFDAAGRIAKVSRRRAADSPSLQE